MVCKEDVCLWFRSLNGPKRLDLLCGLLHLCLPPELRFVASCVEDLARKDFHSLRDAELRANDENQVSKLSKLADLADPKTRSQIITYLALLNSHNIKCANILHDTLTRIFQDLDHITFLTYIVKDSKCIEELLLMLTMATNHPAFSFSQKQTLSHLLVLTERATKEIILPPHVQACKLPDSDDLGSPYSSIGCNCRHKSQCCHDNIGVVQGIECTGSQWNSSNRRMEYHLQVTWSQGDVTELYRTYQELNNFHTQLVTLFPKESGAHKQERHIPFLPQEKVQALNEQLRKYFKSLSAMPSHILHCSHVTTFFLPTNCDKVLVDNDNNKGSSQQMVRSFTVYNSSLPDSPVRPGMNAVHAAGIQSPVSQPVQSPVSSPASSNTNRPDVSQMGSPGTPTCLSGVNSPSNQPPRHSGANSPNNNPQTPTKTSQATLIAQWLKTIRLHKYTDKLTRFTFEQLQQLSEEQLTELGLVSGARKKLLQQLRIASKEGLNGVLVGNREVSSPLSPNRLAPEGRGLLGRGCWGSQASTASSIDSCSTQGSELDFCSPPSSPRPRFVSETHEGMDTEDHHTEERSTSGTLLDSQLSLLSIQGHYIHPPPLQEGHLIHPDGRFIQPLEGHMIPHMLAHPVPDPRILQLNQENLLAGATQDSDVLDNSVMVPPNGHDVFLRQEATPETNQSVAVMIEPNTLNLLGPIGVQTGMPVPSSVVVVDPRSPPVPPSSISENPVEAVVNMPVVTPAEQIDSNAGSSTAAAAPAIPVSSSVEENNITLNQVYMVTTTNVTYTITQSFAVPSQAKSSDMGMYSYQQQPMDGKMPQTRAQGPNTTLIYASTNMTTPLLVPSRDPCSNPSAHVTMAPPITIATPHHAPPVTNIMWPHPLYTLPSHQQGSLPNGLVAPPNLPLTHPIPGINLTNGVNPHYNHQANYSVIQAMGPPRPPGFLPHPGLAVRGMLPTLPPMFHAGNKPKCKDPMCHNCGGGGHWAHDCQEPTMDSVTYSGHFHMNFHLNKPGTEVE